MATLKENLYQTLRDDAVAEIGLHTLLGKTSMPYGIYWLSPPRIPAFPIITYFINAQTKNGLSRSIPFNITSWGSDFVAILDRVYTLLHDKSITVTDYGFVKLLYDWSSAEMFDENFKVYFRQDRFLVTGIRSI